MTSTSTIRAGDLRETVFIKTVTETRGNTGEVLETASTVFTARAMVEPLRGNELAQMQQTQSTVDYRVVVRKRSTAIEPQYTVTWGSKTFDIIHALDIGAEGRFIELLCKERFA